ncbi:DgyrCDS7373 [Dimorphilus gyrociliatus]|uniref:guanylate cyclase n=1 Tax=Dimorphilus gyrociliatus TaxID=2664684 RepID=A0A7I8VVT9_9ANNE|nr:DgyrCDS7373 [Dimorphilus gyrociliatus]
MAKRIRIILFIHLIWPTIIFIRCVKIGVILDRTNNRFSFDRIEDVLEIGRLEVIDRYGIHFDFIKRISNVSECGSKEVILKTAELYKKHNITIFIGPSCSDELFYTAPLISGADLLQITAVGLTIDRSIANIYENTIRLSGNIKISSYRQFITILLNKYNWHKIILLYETTNSEFRIKAEEIFENLDSNVSYNVTLIKINSFDNNTLQDFMLNLQTKGRIFFLFFSFKNEVKFMKFAYKSMMTSSSYVYIAFHSDDEIEEMDIFNKVNSNANAFRQYFYVRYQNPNNTVWNNFKKIVRHHKPDYTLFERNIWQLLYLESVLVLGYVLDRCEDCRLSKRIKGSTILNLLRGRKIFLHDFNDIKFDKNVDKSLGLEFMQYDVIKKKYIPLFSYNTNFGKHQFIPDISWIAGSIPLDEPECGFGRDCSFSILENFSIYFILLIVLLFLVIPIIVRTIVYYRFRLVRESEDNSYFIDWLQVQAVNEYNEDTNSTKSSLNSCSRSQTSSKKLGYDLDEDKILSIFSTDSFKQSHTVIYKQNRVFVKRLENIGITFSKTVQEDLKARRQIDHNNLIEFISISILSNYVFLFEEFCSRGNLQNLILSHDFALEQSLRYELMKDITNGMIYLHKSPIKIHGFLTSKSCVINSRMILKITDFGLNSLREIDGYDPHPSTLLWTAPEVLREHSAISQAADVYSFGIILQELISQSKPFYEQFPPETIVELVKSSSEVSYRPKCAVICPQDLFTLMTNCWNEDYDIRPNFQVAKDILNSIEISKKTYIDNLMARLQMYAKNLEILVEERMEEVKGEKDRSDEILHMMLPKSIARDLKNGKRVRPAKYDCVTILFSDIVGFTELCAKSTPFDVLEFLNSLYESFDAILDQRDVFKVATIGDAFMVASGLPIRNGSTHAIEIAYTALLFISSTKGIN